MNTATPSRRLAQTFWLPAASLVAIELYASRFDGWGAWATAPLFVVPLVLSVIIAGAGALQIGRELRAGSISTWTVMFTLVAAAPSLWLLVRRHIV